MEQLNVKNILSNYWFRLKHMPILSVIQKLLKFMKVYAQENIMMTSLVALLIKLSVLIINLVSQLLFIEAKMLLMNLLKQCLKNVIIVKKIMKKNFNKNFNNE